MKITASGPRLAASHAISSIRESSLITKIILGLLLLGYGVTQIDRDFAIGYLSLKPDKILPPNFWLWSVVTYSFVEKYFSLRIFDLICVQVCCKLIGPVWKPLEALKYVGIVIVSLAIVAPVGCYALYAISHFWTFAIFAPCYGFYGLNGALIVAVKQTFPDDVLLTTPLGRLKNTLMPFLVGLVYVILGALRILYPYPAVQYYLGVYIGWIYLRFYQRHRSTGSKGDPSEHFSFASFFPSLLQPIMGVMSTAVYGVLLKLKICRKPVRRYQAGLTHLVTGTGSYRAGAAKPGAPGALTDAQRQREKAVRELNERLNRVQESSLTKWPSLEDVEAQPESHENVVQSEAPGSLLVEETRPIVSTTKSPVSRDDTANIV